MGFYLISFFHVTDSLCSFLGISDLTLKSWIKHGVIQSIEGTGSGNGKKFTADNLVRLIYFNQLCQKYIIDYNKVHKKEDAKSKESLSESEYKSITRNLAGNLFFKSEFKALLLKGLNELISDINVGNLVRNKDKNSWHREA
jgi:hypothetical protein